MPAYVVARGRELLRLRPQENAEPAAAEKAADPGDR